MIRNAWTGEPHAEKTITPSSDRAQPGAGIAIDDDWAVLLGAVTSRLRETVNNMPPHQFNGTTAPLQTCLLECVDALDQLHASMIDALARTPVQPDQSVDGSQPGNALRMRVNDAAAGPALPVQL